MSSDTISSNLLEKARQRQSDAWQQIAFVYGPIVYQWCRQSKVGEHDAPDVVQEVFRSVYFHIENFRRDRPGDSFRAWLRTITSNKITDFFKGSLYRPRALGGSDMQDRLEQLPFEVETDDNVGDDEVTQRVLKLIQSEFENSTWQAFWRSAVEDQPASRIASDLEMSEGAVRQAKYRVLRRLRDQLDELK